MHIHVVDNIFVNRLAGGDRCWLSYLIFTLFQMKQWTHIYADCLDWFSAAFE